MILPEVTEALVGRKEYPAISLILPTHPQYPHFKVDKEHMIELLSDVASQLAARYSAQKVEEMMQKVNEAVARIDYSKLSESLAVFVSEHQSKVIHLPFAVTEKVIVDDSFEVRDLIYAAKQHRQYLLVSITKNGVKTLMGYGRSFVPVQYKDMPRNIKDVTNSHSIPGWWYLDTAAYDENNIKNFIHFIDETLHRVINGTNLPVIVTGDTKILGIFNSTTTIAQNIAGYIEGNYEHITTVELYKKVEPILSELDVKDREKAMLLLSQAVSQGHYVSGMTEVWRAAKEGRIRLLLLEKDYLQPAHYGDDASEILINDELVGAHRKIADAVDDAVEMVIRHKGDVQFLDNGQLEIHQRIAAVTRY